MHDAPPLAYPWEFVFISSLVIFQSFETEYKNAQQKEIYSLNFVILSLIVLSPNNFIDENRFRQYSAFFFFKSAYPLIEMSRLLLNRLSSFLV